MVLLLSFPMLSVLKSRHPLPMFLKNETTKPFLTQSFYITFRGLDSLKSIYWSFQVYVKYVFQVQ